MSQNKFETNLTLFSPLFYRYLQTLTNISAEKNSTILFPLPIDVLSHFFKVKK